MRLNHSEHLLSIHRLCLIQLDVAGAVVQTQVLLRRFSQVFSYEGVLANTSQSKSSRRIDAHQSFQYANGSLR
jgi:hypothetical protein